MKGEEIEAVDSSVQETNDLAEVKAEEETTEN